MLSWFVTTDCISGYCRTASCSVITNEPCLSVKRRPQRLLAVLWELGAGDKSFPVSGLSCTRGSVLCLCQPVTR